jgi:hypothetical protein
LSVREKVDGILWLNLNVIPILSLILMISSIGTFISLIFGQVISMPGINIPVPVSYALMILGLGATIGTVFAGLYKVKQIRYLIFAISMMINSQFMCFTVGAKAYFDILTNRPFKWIKTERNGIVTV